LYRSLTLMPLLLAIVLGSLVIFGHLPVVASVLIALWGMGFGVVQVGWMAWLARTAPDEAESGGAVQIASIQLAIMAGAGIGGIFFDQVGARSVFVASGAFTGIAALVTWGTFKKRPR
jgi:predicted MFS family arabinose efflux permease